MLSVIVLSYNRKDVLRRTLGHLRAILPTITGESETIVVDNNSTDQSAEMVAADFSDVRLLRLPENVGVAAFNRAAEIAKGDFLLILDDDAWPDGPSLQAALDYLRPEDDVHASIALMPVHPATGVVEWPFLDRPQTYWPFMGCGNLIRKSAWDHLGGYEESFFLYRNDTDLALKLLGSGLECDASPDWIVWHDSPHAARKSDRWLELATKNWVLLARRHARGWRLPFAIVLGWLSSCRHAGLSLHRLRLVTRGFLAGVRTSVPSWRHADSNTGSDFANLLRIQLRGRRVCAPRKPFIDHAPAAGTIASNIPRHSP